jgi:hypothetical protein
MEIGDVYLDSITMRSHVVGYGALGTGGSLGYEDKMVRVHGNSYSHAFSAHLQHGSCFSSMADSADFAVA